MKTIEKCLLFGFVMTLLLNLTVFSGRCENINDKIFRLHILANSNSKEDQDLKLKVRDAILNKTSDIFSTAQNKNDAIQISLDNVNFIKQIAKNEIKQNGYDYDVDVQVVNMHFNTRYYNDFTMPAGNYDALRVLIGKSEGQNWWCVMFPAVCIPAAEPKHELSDVLTASEEEITFSQDQYDVQFKVLEYFEVVKDFFRKICGCENDLLDDTLEI